MSVLHALWDVAATTATWFVSGLGTALVRAAVEGGILLLAVALLVKLLPRIPAPARTALWWLACGKLLLALAPHAPLAIAPRNTPLDRPTEWAKARIAPWVGSVAVNESPVATVEPERKSQDCGDCCKDKHAGAVAGDRDDAGGGTPAPAAEPGNSDNGGATTFASFAPAAIPALLNLPLPGSAGTAFPASIRDALTELIAMALFLWLAGTLVFAVRLVRERRALHAAWRTAEPLTDPALLVLAREWLPRRRLLRAAEIRVSHTEAVPMTLGWWRPRVLLPHSSLADGRSARLALAHELVHVRRHDLLLGWVPALAHMLFWFHPLVAWGVREYVQAREEACDAEALRLTGAAPREYGELLLRYGVVDDLASAAVASCGSRTARALHRRLSMLAHLARPTFLQRAVSASAVMLALVAMLPLRVVARSAAPEAQVQSEPAVEQSDPEKAGKADMQDAGQPDQVPAVDQLSDDTEPTPTAEPPAAEPSTAGFGPMPSVVATPAADAQVSSGDEWKEKDKEKEKYLEDKFAKAKVKLEEAAARFPAGDEKDSDDIGYLIETAGSQSTRGDLNMHDLEVLKHARARYPDVDFVLMRISGRSWLITDPDFRREVLHLLAPMDQYDRVREEYEKREEAFGSRLEEVAQAAESAQELVDKFGDQIDAVSERIDAAAGKGQSVQALQARRADLMVRKDQARAAASKADALRRELEAQETSQSEEGERFEAEAGKIHAEIKLQIGELARDAIARGIAVSVK